MIGSPMQLGRRRLNRILLERQLLRERSQLSPTAAMEHLVGMQSQTPTSAYFGLWSRIAGFDPASLSLAMTERRAVRIALQRSTIHLVSADDCLALRPVMQPVLEKGLNGAFRRRLEGVDRAAVAAAGRALVDERPRTFAELGALLDEQFPGSDPQALAMAVRTSVALVQVPPRGVWGRSGPVAHTSAEAWLGRPLAGSAEPDVAVLRYLRAFGPASVKDVAVWSGLTGIRAIIERLAPQLRQFTDEHGTVLWDVLDAPLPDAEGDVPPRFLPDYDNILLSHADRSRVIAAGHRPLIFSGNGVFATVLVDGFAAATWKLAGATITVRPFAKLSRSDRAAVADEGMRLLEFAAPAGESPDVRFTTP